MKWSDLIGRKIIAVVDDEMGNAFKRITFDDGNFVTVSLYKIYDEDGECLDD